MESKSNSGKKRKHSSSHVDSSRVKEEKPLTQIEEVTDSSPKRQKPVKTQLPPSEWRFLLTKENIERITVQNNSSFKKPSDNVSYWVSWDLSGKPSKFFIPTPRYLSLDDCYLAGSGNVYKNNVMEGKQKCSLYVNRKICEERARKLHKIDPKDPLTPHAQADCDFMIKDGTEFLEHMHLVDEKIISELYKQKICFEQHTKKYTESRVQELRAKDELDNKPILSTKDYMKRLNESYEERYRLNIYFPPKEKEKGSGVFLYEDMKDMEKKILDTSKVINLRRAAWRKVYGNPKEREITLKNALEAARVDEELCKEKGWRCDTAMRQFIQKGETDPKCFHPVIYREPIKHNIIPKIPFDGTPVKEGDLVSTTLFYRLTQYNGIVYVRKSFDELVIHYVCERSPIKQARTAEHRPETSVIDAPFSMPENLFPEPKEGTEEVSEDL